MMYLPTIGFIIRYKQYYNKHWQLPHNDVSLTTEAPNRIECTGNLLTLAPTKKLIALRTLSLKSELHVIFHPHVICKCTKDFRYKYFISETKYEKLQPKNEQKGDVKSLILQTASDGIHYTQQENLHPSPVQSI